MPKEEKVQEVARLAEMLEKGRLALFTDFRGMHSQEMTELRRRLREKGVDYRVIKNTLMALALDKAGKGEGKVLLQGPTAVAVGYGEEVETARIFAEFLRQSKTLKLRGALLVDRVLRSEEVLALAALPPREVLLSKVLGTMHSPLARLLGVLQAPMAGLLLVLQARSKQIEGGS